MKDYGKNIGSHPYPENIFKDKNGEIKYIEGGLQQGEDLDKILEHFKLIIDELLLPAHAHK
jgi:hypothetical protein